MDKQKDNLRLAGLRLLLLEDDAARVVEHINDGRIELARVFASAVVKHIKEVQADLDNVK